MPGGGRRFYRRLGELAEKCGARVFRMKERKGPAYARNQAAAGRAR